MCKKWNNCWHICFFFHFGNAVAFVQSVRYLLLWQCNVRAWVLGVVLAESQFRSQYLLLKRKKKSRAVTCNLDQACLYLRLPWERSLRHRTWLTLLPHSWHIFLCFFFLLLLFSPSIVILLGLRKWYYHLQASFAAFVLAAKVPHCATRSFYCPP